MCAWPNFLRIKQNSKAKVCSRRVPERPEARQYTAVEKAMELGKEQTCLTIALDVNFGEVVSAKSLFDIPEVAEQDLDVVFKVSGFGSENPAHKKV